MPPDDSSDDPNLGKIERAYSIQYDRLTASTPAAVWDAITKPHIVSKWMGYPARIELRIGGDYFLDFGADSGENLDGVIVALESEKSLRYSWGLSVLEWRLEADEATGGCRYSFGHHGMPIRGIPDEQGVAAGWHSWLEALEASLSGITRPAERDRDCCETVGPAYRRAIEAEIGPI